MFRNIIDTKGILRDWVPAVKATNSNMIARDTQFALGGTFSKSESEPIKVCESGYHVCGDIFSVNNYYRLFAGHCGNDQCKIFWNPDNFRVFNVSIRGNVSYDAADKDKISAQEIRFDSEIDLANGTFVHPNKKWFIKVSDNKVHCDDGPAVDMNGIQAYVSHGVITKMESKNFRYVYTPEKYLLAKIAMNKASRETGELVYDEYVYGCETMIDELFKRVESPAIKIINHIEPVVVEPVVVEPVVVEPVVVESYKQNSYGPQFKQVYHHPQPFWFAPIAPMAGFGVRYY